MVSGSNLLKARVIVLMRVVAEPDLVTQLASPEVFFTKELYPIYERLLSGDRIIEDELDNILEVKTPFDEEERQELWETALGMEEDEFVGFYEYWLKFIILRKGLTHMLNIIYDPDSVVSMLVKLTEESILNSNIKIQTADKELEDLTATAALKFGYKHWDSIVEATPGELIIIAARPSVGKTTFMLNLMRKAAGTKDDFFTADVRTAFLSLEMSRREIIKRLIMMIKGIDKESVESKLEELKKDRDVKRLLSRMIIYEGSSSLDSILSFMRRMAYKGVRVFFVDYLQLIRMRTKSGNRNEELSIISRALKNFAKENDVIVFAGSQLNREVTKSDKPSLHHLRDSGSLEQDADTVMFLIPKTSGTMNIIMIDVQKHRNGKLGLAAFLFNKNTQRFSETRNSDFEDAG